MYDLADLAKKAFFHPATKGSSSLKKVLPAVMASSRYLRARYERPIYGADGGIGSHNYRNWQWWQARADGTPRNPYELLPPVFDDLPAGALEALESDDEMAVAEGGAATTAWARIQFEDSAELERERIAKALLRYCELDTLAMVMVYEAWRDWLNPQRTRALSDACLLLPALPSAMKGGMRLGSKRHGAIGRTHRRGQRIGGRREGDA